MNNIFVSIAWVVFRTENLKQAGEILSGFFRTEGITYVNIYVIIYAIIIMIFHFMLSKTYRIL